MSGGPPGTLLAPHSEWSGWLVSFLTAAIAVGVIEWFAAQAPIPPGGDSGQWTALSYPYAFLPHPSLVYLWGYPPGMFPLMGLLVRLGGGPILGARLYIAVVGVLLGLSVYALGRSLFRRRSTALLAEALLFVDTPFLRLFFFGGFPTLLALVFMNLALAFLIRYLRSRKQSHLLVFWLATAATALTHEFIGIVLLVALVLIGLFLLWKGRLPRQVILSPAGGFGAALGLLSVGGFYVGARLLTRAPQPNYLTQGAAGHLRFPLSPLLYPLHVQELGGILGLHLVQNLASPHIATSGTGSFEVTVGLTLLLFAGLVALGWRRPKWLTLPILTVTCTVMAVLLMGIGGWALSVYTDYRRFAYALYLPFILGGVYAYDTLFHWCSPTRPSAAGPVAAAAAPAASLRRATLGTVRLRPRSARSSGEVLTQAMSALAIVAILIGGAVFVYPDLAAYEQKYTGNSHSQEYLDAMEAIAQSGIPGSVLGVSGGAAVHWTLALTDRNVYAPAIPNFVFKKAKVLDDQLAFFALKYRYAVSNGIDFVGVPGNSSLFFDASPAYGALRLGYPVPLLNVPPQSIFATLESGTVLPAYTSSQPVPRYTLVNATNPELTVHYVDPGFTVDVTSSPLRNGTTMVALTLRATGNDTFQSFSAGLNPPAGTRITPIAITGNTFQWALKGPQFKPLLTTGVLEPPASLVPTSGLGNLRAGSVLRLEVASAVPGGSSTLSLVLYLSTPGALPLITLLPPVMVAPQILTNWNVRFVVFNNVSQAQENSEALYLHDEYGGSCFWHRAGARWEDLLLPTSLAPSSLAFVCPPRGLPIG